MQDAAGDPLAHRDAGGGELIVLRLTCLVLIVAARVHQETDLDAPLPRRDERVRIARVGDHPEAHIDLDGFLLDVGEDVGAAILEGRVAHPIFGGEGLGGGGRG